MNIRCAVFAVIALFLTASAAEAKRHHTYHHHRHHLQHIDKAPQMVGSSFYDNDGHITQFNSVQRITGYSSGSYSDTTERIVGGRPSGCPWQYCGCSAAIRVFGRIIPALNLAAAWLRFPRAAPAPGMVAARNHHVFVIEAINGDGTVVAYDGNSGGHRTRIHTVSLRGYSVVNPHASRVAMN